MTKWLGAELSSCSQKTMNIQVILNGAELREASRGLKNRDVWRRSEYQKIVF
jgi:hypothetical protein